MPQTAVHALIRDRYRTAHGAEPAADYPAYVSIGSPDAPLAVLGYRLAGPQPLFLEAYLSAPIEQLLTARLGRPVPRARVVELGDHASARPAATVALWREAAAALDGQADVAVAVLTAPLRAMFARLGMPLIMLAPARAEALGAAGAEWGRYYQSDPMVCAGDIAGSRRLLDRSMGA